MTIGKRLPASRHRTNDSPAQRAANGRRKPLSGDRLGAAAWLIAAAAGLVVMAMIVAACDGIRGLEKPSATERHFYHAFGLSEPALIPAGRRAQNPVWRPSTVDWRYQPELPQQDPGLIPLLAAEDLAGPKASLP